MTKYVNEESPSDAAYIDKLLESIQWLKCVVEWQQEAMDNSGDRVAVLEVMGPGGDTEGCALDLTLNLCNKEFLRFYGDKPLVNRRRSREPEKLSEIEHERYLGAFKNPPRIDLDKLIGRGMKSNAQVLAELKVSKERQKLHYYLLDSDGLIGDGNVNLLVSEIRKGQLLFLSERDMSPLIKLFGAVESWRRKDGARETYDAIVRSFSPNGELGFLGFSFCRLWTKLARSDEFRSEAEFGLKQERNQDAFRQGRVRFTRKDGWLFHAASLREPAIYEEASVDGLEPDAPPMKTTHPRGFPYYIVPFQAWPPELEIEHPHEWLDAALIAAGQVVGSLSFSVPGKLNSGSWAILKLACQGAGFALLAAQSRQEKLDWLKQVEHASDALTRGVFYRLNTAIKLGKDICGFDRDILDLLVAANRVDGDVKTQRKKFNFVATECYEPTWATGDIVESLESVCSQVRDGLVVEFCPMVGSLELTTDFGEIRVVVSELIANALEGNGDAGASKVVVKVDSADGWCVIDVIDDGPGILSRFGDDLFRQTVSSSKSTGTGIGLFMCHRIVTTLGGDLEHITTTRGAHFRIRLPLINAGKTQEKPK
jgi:anti-sigma regulatory factor (Ser/Thr protein kinase)